MTETINLEQTADHRTMVIAARSSAILGSRAYDKLFNLSLSELRTIGYFINILEQIKLAEDEIATREEV
jgi:hypothetical protein